MIGEHESTARMGRARLLGDQPRLVYATDIPLNKEKWKNKQFLCEHCPARVHPRSTPRTETSSGRQPHFARNPTSAAHPNEHAKGCLYDIERQIDELIETSEDQLERPTRGHPKYRLPWPDTFQQQDPRHPLEAPANDFDAVAYQRKLRPLLNTAAKIAALLTSYRQSGSDPGVEVEATCQKRPVDWMNFLYTPNRAWVLAQRLRKTGPLDHPVAVIFRAAPIRVKNADWSWLQSSIPVPKGHEPPSEILFVDGHPTAMTAAFATTEQSGANQLCIGYGVWSLTKRRGDLPQRLSLHLADISCVAFLPPEVTAASLKHWRSGLPDVDPT